MKQAYMPQPGKILYRDVPLPVLEPNSLILEVERIGICGSDLHVFSGKHPLVSYPLVQGHEFSGHVRKVGKTVSGFAAGDLAAVQPAVGCGKCGRCRAGLIAQCDDLRFIGGSLTGGGSELFLVDAGQAIKMPPGVTVDQAALVEPAAVAVHAVSRLGPVEGEAILITGGGTIGNLIAQVCRSHGASRIVVSERIELRRNILRSMGFHTIKPGEAQGFEGEVARLLGGKPTIAFECAGNDRALNSSIRAIVRGGTVVVVAVYEQPPQAEMVLVQDKELLLAGSLMYTWEDYHRAVGLIEKGAIDVRSLITHHVPFDRWEDGYHLLLDHPDEVLKVVVDV